MPKSAEVPDSNSPDFKNKVALISKLRGDNLVASAASLHELGVALSANTLLSNKQQDALVSGLVGASLLTYQANYFAALEKAEEEGQFAEVERKMNASIDLVRWKIEQDGKLQARTIVAATQLDGQPSPAQRVTITANLMNTAHLATKTNSYAPTPYDDERYQLSFSQVDATEAEVFENRVLYGAELVEEGLAALQETGGLEEFDIDSFRTSELCDRMIALHFVKKSTATDTVGRFRELQDVVYTGYTIGVRDANATNARLYGDGE